MPRYAALGGQGMGPVQLGGVATQFSSHCGYTIGQNKNRPMSSAVMTPIKLWRQMFITVLLGVAARIHLLATGIA
jgi:hypothetical protein